MPLESSRRLLAGGRYTQLPPVPEDDQLNQSNASRTNDPPQHLSNGFQSANGRNGYNQNGVGHQNCFKSDGQDVPQTVNKTSSQTFTSTCRYGSSSSLVHTDGAVVPQAMPHQTKVSSLKLHTEVKLSQGKATVRPIQQPRQNPIRPFRKGAVASFDSASRFQMVSRPCLRNKAPSSPPPTPPVRPPRIRRGTRGSALFKAVTNREGRGGYKTLSPPPSVSGTPSPPYTPPPRSPHPGILINSSAIARQGIKRLTR